MKQVSITAHRDAPTSVYIDRAISHADSVAQIGAVLRDAGIKPDTRVDVMTASGKTDRVLAHQFLQHAPKPAKKRGRK